MNQLLRYLKTLCTKKQSENYDKIILTRQLLHKYKGRMSLLEIKEYVNTLKPEEIERLVNVKERKQS